MIRILLLAVVLVVVSATEAATFGAGCFWCTESMFSKLKGVQSALPGYSGGQTVDPKYEDVKKGTTGHAEVVHIQFDPAVITFNQLLDAFWLAHDPTTLNRQGVDVGTQYRSVIYYHSEEQ